MADLTKTTGVILLGGGSQEWNTVDDNASVSGDFVESAELDCGVFLETTLHIDVCQSNNSVGAAATPIKVRVLVKSNDTSGTDHDWHLLTELQAFSTVTYGGTAATYGTIDLNTTSAPVSSTAFFNPGDPVLLKGDTYTEYELVWIADVTTTNYKLMDPVDFSHDDGGGSLYAVLGQFNVSIPPSVSVCKVFFINTDEDATYEVRVRYTGVSEIV